jgi:hypothetical protein
LLALVACDAPLSINQQIIAEIRNMEAHVEAGERRAFMNSLHVDFSGQNGEFNHDRMNALLLFFLKRYQQLNVQILPVQVTADGTEVADANFQVLVTAGNGLLPESGQLFTVSSRWMLVDGEWLVIEAQWEPVRIDPLQ